jgi:glutamine synthetase
VRTYLAFAALLMAGLDGIKNKIHPGQPMDKDLYDLPPKELKKIPTVCGSLRKRQSLDKDRGFLKAGGVFDDDQIDSYIELKMAEVMRFEMTPHPLNSTCIIRVVPDFRCFPVIPELLAASRTPPCPGGVF